MKKIICLFAAMFSLSAAESSFDISTHITPISPTEYHINLTLVKTNGEDNSEEIIMNPLISCELGKSADYQTNDEQGNSFQLQLALSEEKILQSSVVVQMNYETVCTWHNTIDLN